MTDPIRPCLSPSEVLAYLDGTLPAAGRAEVDRHLATCRLCEAAVEGVAALEWREGFLRSTDALLAKVRARTAAAAATTRAPRQPWGFRHALQLMAVAATLIVGVGTAIVLTRPKPGETLFRDSFEPYPSARPVVRGDRAAGDPGPLALYEAGDYGAALVGLEERLRQEPNDPLARFYAGICRLALGRTREAAVDLEQVLRVGDEDLHAPAEWYLALTHLRANDLGGARAALERLASAKGFYRERARTLLSELDRIEKHPDSR